MSGATRRAIFAAAPIFAIAAAPAIPAIAATNPDAQLLALDAELTQRIAEKDRLGSVVDLAADRRDALTPKPPEALRRQFIDYGAITGVGRGEGYYSAMDLKAVRESLERHRATARNNNGLNTGFVVRCEEIVEAIEAYEPKREEAKRRSGLLEAEAAWEAAFDRVTEIELEIMAIRAQTKAGMAVKARLLATYSEFADDPPFEQKIMRSLLADVGVMV